MIKDIQILDAKGQMYETPQSPNDLINNRNYINSSFLELEGSLDIYIHRHIWIERYVCMYVCFDLYVYTIAICFMSILFFDQNKGVVWIYMDMSIYG